MTELKDSGVYILERQLGDPERRAALHQLAEAAAKRAPQPTLSIPDHVWADIMGRLTGAFDPARKRPS